MLELNVIETGISGSTWGIAQRKTTRHADWGRLVNSVSKDRGRRRIIRATICKDLNRRRRVLVVSDRKELAEHLYYSLKSPPKYEVGYLHGKLPQRERDLLWKQIGERTLRCLVTTRVGAHVSGSTTWFDTVHLVTPTSPHHFIQRIASLLRDVPRKNKPVVRYYLDDHSWLRATLAKSEQELDKVLRRRKP